MSKRGEEKRALLIAATRTVVERLGPRKATLDDIAREARVSRSAVYYHFPSKGEMLKALIDHEIEQLRATVLAAVPTDAPADQRLVSHFIAMAGEVQRLVTLYTVTTDIAGELVPMAMKRVDEFQRWNQAQVTSILGDGAAAGVFLVDDPDLLAATIQASFRSLLDPSLIDDTSHMVEQASALLRVILRGISANPSSEAPC